MDEMKHRLLGLINKQVSQDKIPVVTYTKCLEDQIPLKSVPPSHKEVQETDIVIEESKHDDDDDDDVLDSIEEIYFTKNHDFVKYALEKLVTNLQLEELESNLHRLQAQMAAISKKLLGMILQNQPACQKEFEKMQELHCRLTSSLSMCREARLNLREAQRSVTTASLGILSNYRKRKVSLDLLRSLSTIKTLVQSEMHLEELLAEQDFSGAISLLLECQQAALTYRHFHCVVSLSGKLQDTLVMAEEQLDVALAKICYEFDNEVYSKLQSAYRQLCKRRIAMDQLHMHYITAVHSSAFDVVYKYARRENSPTSKKPYPQLCKKIDNSNLIDCLLSLCQKLWRILRSYNQVVQWHASNQSADEASFEESVDEQYIKQKLETGLNKLWFDVQSRVSLLITSADVSGFKFDDFLQMLTILHRLIQIGEEFCNSNSAELQASMKEQSCNFFRKYHQSRLGELHLFLENEAWTPCPVKNNFNLLHLQEFRNLRYAVQNASLKKFSDTSNCIDQISSSSSGYFSRYLECAGTPFDTCVDFDTSLSTEEDILATDDANSEYGTDESDNEDQRKRPGPHCVKKKSCTLLSNTTLTVVRYCGKYLQMSGLLHCITSEVIECLCQLFEYYLYAVYTFFTDDTITESTRNSSFKLQAILKRIEDNIFADGSDEGSTREKVLRPSLSSAVDLNDAETLYGLTERIVAVESLLLLAEQFYVLRKYLESLVDNEDDKHALSNFYSQVIAVAYDIRKPVYECVSRKVIDCKSIFFLMSKVNWEVKDIMCQHSQYVDVLLRELQIFSMRLETIEMNIYIPPEVKNCLWLCLAEFLSEIFVEGFSNVKKCSNGGRALMQLDYTQFVSKLEAMSSLKPIPRRDFVETYVKAYYLPEMTLQTWITDHTEYSPKQLQSLVNCTCWSNKKMRQKLIGIIEDMERQ